MRKASLWNVTLQGEDGEVTQYPFKTFWDPTQEGAAEAVTNAATAQAWYAGGKRIKYFGISAALSDGEAKAA